MLKKFTREPKRELGKRQRIAIGHPGPLPGREAIISRMVSPHLAQRNRYWE